MSFSSVIRIVASMSAAMTFALAVANLVISFKVLRPKSHTWDAWWGSGAGFLWGHVVTVVLGFQGFVLWGLVEVQDRVDQSLTWRPFALLFLTSLLNTGYFIIFRIEMARLKLKTLVEVE